MARPALALLESNIRIQENDLVARVIGELITSTTDRDEMDFNGADQHHIPCVTPCVTLMISAPD
jgi:hypothetical protein